MSICMYLDSIKHKLLFHDVCCQGSLEIELCLGAQSTFGLLHSGVLL